MNSEVRRLPRDSSSPSGRMLTGICPRSPAAGSASPRRSRRLRRPPAHAARATSLTVPPRLDLIALKSSSVKRSARKRRVAPIGTLRLDLGAGTSSSRTSTPAIARALEAISSSCSGCRARSAAARTPCQSSPGGTTTAGAARSRPVGVCGVERRARAHIGVTSLSPSIRRRVEEQLSDVDPSDAIDQAVVDLAHHRPAVIGQALEQGHLPQRPRPVQAMGVEVRDPGEQLLVASGRAASPGACGR